jgi:hypothetical protein
MDIAAWLDGLGLGQYEQAFRDNEIDERVLPSLTTGDLKDLDVKLVGHRRRLLDAIAALGAPMPVVAATARTDGVAPRSLTYARACARAYVRLKLRESRMVPDHCDFTTSSAFRATGQPPTRGALVTAT